MRIIHNIRTCVLFFSAAAASSYSHCHAYTKVQMQYQTRPFTRMANAISDPSRTLFALEYALPIWTSAQAERTIFSDLRGKVQGLNNFELNAGLAYRSILNRYGTLGLYSFYDRMILENKSYNQFTFGFDVFDISGLGIRFNFYNPLAVEHHIASTTPTGQNADGRETAIFTEYYRSPLRGFEIETEQDYMKGPYRGIGTLGGFWFKNPKQAFSASEKGLRVRVAIEQHNFRGWVPALRMIWEKPIGSSDNEDSSSSSASSVSVAFSISSKAHQANRSMQYNRLFKPIYRDIDIRTQKNDVRTRTIVAKKFPTVPTNKHIIPNYLFQTHYDTSRIPKRITDAVLAKSTGYEYYLFEDDDIRVFLAKYFPDFSDTFEQLHGAHRADLARYLLLYQFGGVYFDIKAVPKKHLDDIFDRNQNTFYTAISHGWFEDWHWKSLHQSILASPPNNPMLLKAAQHVYDLLQSGNEWETITNNPYDWLIEDLFRIVENSTGQSDLHTGMNLSRLKNHPNVYLFRESCSDTGLVPGGGVCPETDWRGSCCLILDKDPIFLGRDPLYPW